MEGSSTKLLPDFSLLVAIWVLPTEFLFYLLYSEFFFFLFGSKHHQNYILLKNICSYPDLLTNVLWDFVKYQDWKKTFSMHSFEVSQNKIRQVCCIAESFFFSF